MASLLQAVASKRGGWDYVRRLLTAVRDHGTGRTVTRRRSPVSSSP